MKTYSRHCQLVYDMQEHISPPHFVIFKKEGWEINGINFKPVLHNERYEKEKWLGEEIENYIFEASVEENLKIYEAERALEMDKRSKIPFYKKWKEAEWFNRTGFAWQDLFGNPFRG